MAAEQKPEPAKPESKPVSTRVEHFFVFAPEAQAKTLFEFFRDDFRLPQAWAFKNWGSYTSGGLSLGNVAMEVATYPTPDDKNPKIPKAPRPRLPGPWRRCYGLRPPSFCLCSRRA
jgi:hypothetical protein